MADWTLEWWTLAAFLAGLMCGGSIGAWVMAAIVAGDMGDDDE